MFLSCLKFDYESLIGGIVLSGGLISFIFSRNPSALSSLISGGALLALSTLSLKIWRQGKSSLPFILGQTGNWFCFSFKSVVSPSNCTSDMQYDQKKKKKKLYPYCLLFGLFWWVIFLYAPRVFSHLFPMRVLFLSKGKYIIYSYNML